MSPVPRAPVLAGQVGGGALPCTDLLVGEEWFSQRSCQSREQLQFPFQPAPRLLALLLLPGGTGGPTPPPVSPPRHAGPGEVHSMLLPSFRQRRFRPF